MDLCIEEIDSRRMSQHGAKIGVRGVTYNSVLARLRN